MKVYLSGPISGSLDELIVDWRRRVLEFLPSGVEVFDPALAHYDATPAHAQPETAEAALERLRHGMLVVDRNKHLIQSSDLVLANLLAADHASIGAIGELFWANAFRVPIVIVRERDGNVHDHAMLNAIASIVTHSLEDGCTAAVNMLQTETRLGRRKVSATARGRAGTNHKP